MEQKNNKPNLNEFVNALEALAVLEGKMAKRPVDTEFVQNLKLWSTGLFRIVVMGEIKKGKSSFINALLGVRDLVPVSSNVATSTIYKICYGEKVAYKVFFTEASKKPCVLIDKSQLAEYGTEDGNPANEKQVDFIQVFVPSPFLKQGLVIIDTPGLGGLFKQHKRITYEYVPKADAVVMVSDSVESPIGKAELDLLDDIKKVTDQVFFVQTKGMAVDAEARQARERNNRLTLERHGFDAASLRYFVVDSHLKHEADEAKDKEDLRDSGFVPLARFINTEIGANVRSNIMRKAVKVAMPKFAAIESALSDEEKMLSADTEESRKKIADELASAEEEASNWQRYELPRMQDRLQDGLREVKTKAADRARRFRPGGEVQEVVSQTISACPDIESLFDRLNEFSQNAGDCYTQERYAILEEVRSEVEKLLQAMDEGKYEISTQLEPTAARDTAVEVNMSPVSRVMEGNANGSLFEDLRTGFYGGAAGSTIGGFVGGVIGSIVPGIGNAIGAYLGGIVGGFWGGTQAAAVKKSNDLERAKQQAMSAVAQTISSAYQNLIESVQRVLADIESSVVRAMRDAVARRQEDILNRRKELQSRQSETTAQLLAKRGELDANKREFRALKGIVIRGV